MSNKKTSRLIDIILLILFPIIASFITIHFKTNLLISIFLFFGISSLYLSLRNPGIVFKSAIFAFLFSLPLSLFIDTLAVLDESWIVPLTVFPFKFFGLATVEVYLFGLLWVFLVILFYEHFFDKGKWKDKIDKKIKYLIYLFIFLISIVTIFFFINLNLLRIPYFYLWVSLVFIIPPLFLFLYYYPKFLQRYLLAGIYFFFLMLTFELVALEVEQWIFPSQHFIGFIELFKYRFPLEELFFWMIFATPSLLAYYEFFADDRRL